MKKVFILLLTTTLLSCLNQSSNEEKKNNNITESVQEQKKSKALVFELDLEMSEPEDIKLIAINTFLNNGQYIDIYITQKVNANERTKTILFELPDNISPDNFVGVSLGSNEVKEVKINNIKLSYRDLNYNIESDAVLDYFKTNKFLEYNETSKVFKTKKVNGKHNPILILRKIYIDKIQGIR